MSCSESQVQDFVIEEQLLISAHKESAVVNSNQVDKDSVSIAEHEPRTTRIRTRTEKGQAYHEQRQQEQEKDEDRLIKKFHEAYNAWKTQAMDIELLMPEQFPSSQIERNEAILHLKDLRDKTEKIYEKLRNARPPGQEIRRKMDACDVLTQTLEQQFIRGDSVASRNDEDRRSV